MSLRARLIGLLLVLVAVVAVTTVSVFTVMQRFSSHHDLVADRLQPASVQSRQLLVSLVDQQTGQRGFVLTGDEGFLSPYRAGEASFGRTLAQLRGDARGDATLGGALDRVEQAADRWRSVGATPEIRARRAGNVDRAERLVRIGRGESAFDDVRRRVEDVQELIDVRSARAQQRDESDLRLLEIVITSSRLALLVILLLGAFLMRHWVLEPVNRLRTRMRIVADGRIEEEVLVSGPPEVVAIARDAENMRRRIVSELEATRGATEALSQHSPVVVALRGELASRPRPDPAGVEIVGHVQAAQGVLAGDWWDAVPRPNGRTALVLADVSGHGPEAGLVAYAFKQRLTALLDSGLELGAAFALAAQRPDLDDERFMSCLVVEVDPVGRDLAWVNAGHPAALLVAREGRRVLAELAPTGPLISSVSSGWRVAHAMIGVGDLLVACTDGVLEARDAEGAELGTVGLLAVLRELVAWTPANAVEATLSAVRRFAVDVRRDDVTVVAMALAPVSLR